MTAADIMRGAGEFVHIDHAVSEAIVHMADNDRNVFVVDGDELVGVITDTDIAEKCEAKSLNPNDIHAGEIMTPCIPYCRLHDDVTAVVRTMKDLDASLLAVLDDQDEMVGEVILRDVERCADTDALSRDEVRWLRKRLRKTKALRGEATEGRSFPRTSGGPRRYAVRPKLRFKAPRR
ncbi:MAG: CBS domain-containing protein [Rhodospirillales bacterium]